ncbi:MAG: DUF6273 domain-containing protein [Oscillospiraceae bacterium]|nr:DUF6273 domain-containing protein [Oscillospiraceae bacterium]
MKANDVIQFGSYPQSNPYSNVSEPIEWLVLAVEDGKALLFCKNCIDNIRYHNELVPSTWENCTLRKWCNETFLNAAFSAEEQAKILETRLSNPGNQQFNTAGCEDTSDKVFALSIDELERYLPNKKDRLAPATEVAKNHGAYVYPDTGNAIWWLRSPGCNEINASRVSVGGSVCGLIYDDARPHRTARPAMWIKAE